ncbi:hypothetical protein NRIC_28100 [Enterococcus florum]|uniref:DUF5131 family protein n=1 Tax=Enterococcus florum TaxID=2480627 RepID=A0A4V0WPS9_9ENTE|nr:DUF5131 family protein [Enterococcus florum]GCF94919.1 hypothetical protein NRIC_28100 [Enterococcus florum]
MAIWNPWKGCHRVSDGCRYCFIHEGGKKRDRDTHVIEKTAQFDAPVKQTKKSYKMASGQQVFVCFSSDFFVEDADEWRDDCWRMMRERSDLNFLFLTKRIERFYGVIPKDWGSGYENVTIGVSVENQQFADQRLSFLQSLPIKHKTIACQPMLGPISLNGYLEDVELVVAGGEYHKTARPLEFEWILALREECIDQQVAFEFRQCGTHFIKDGQHYRLGYRQLFSQAKKADINWYPA